ncbi:trichohyalin-like [Montipora capricornis]|uniref:trichohyalin-like n=1 Tax=Montipora capricornis TaxID=246305 RepID=UPI0035F11517
MEGQLLEAQFEIQNGGHVEMTSESLVANMGSQVQMQMANNEQVGSFEMSGDGIIMMMQSDENVEQQSYFQGGTSVQINSQELNIDSQLDGFARMAEGQQFIPDGDSLQTEEMQGQNMGMTELSMKGLAQFDEKFICSNNQGLQISEMTVQETGFVEGGEIQMSGMSIEEMGFIGEGKIEGEMSLEMNGAQMEMQEMSMPEMSLESQSREISFVEGGTLQESEMAIQQVGSLEGGEIGVKDMTMTGEMVMAEMSLEMGRSQMRSNEARIQQLPLELQSHGISLVGEGEVQDGEPTFETRGFVEWEGVQTSEMSISELTCEMSGQEMQIQEMTMQGIPLEGGEYLINETIIQEVGVVEGAEIQMSGEEMIRQGIPLEGGESLISEITIQEVGVMQGAEIQISEMSMSELTCEMSGQEMQIQEMTMQGIPLEGGEYLVNETIIQEVGVVEGAETQMSEMSIPQLTCEMGGEEMIREGIPLEGGESVISETTIQEVGVVEGAEIQISELSMSDLTCEMSGQEMQIQEMTMQGIPLEGGECLINDTIIQEVGVVENAEIQMSEMSISQLTYEMSGEEMIREGIPLEGGESVISETTIQEVGVVEGAEIQITEISISELTCEMSGDEMQIQEMTMQGIPLEGGDYLISDTIIQEVGVVEGAEIQMSEMSMSELTCEMSGQEMQLQEMTLQGITLEGGEYLMSDTTIHEVGGMESAEIKMSEMSMSELTCEMSGHEVQIQEITMQGIPQEGGENLIIETTTQERGFMDEDQTLMSEVSRSEMTLGTGGLEMQLQELSIQEILSEEAIEQELSVQDITLQDGEHMLETMIQQVGFLGGDEMQATEISMSETMLQVGGQEIISQELSEEQLPSEMPQLQLIKSTAIEEEGFEEVKEKQLIETQMSEMVLEIGGQELHIMSDSIEEVPLEEGDHVIQEVKFGEGGEIEIKEMLASEMTLEMSGQEMQTQDVSTQEIPSEIQLTTIQETYMQGTSTQDLPVETQENVMQEMIVQENPLKMQESNLQDTTIQVALQERPLKEMQLEIQELCMLEIKESAVLEGGEIQLNETTVQKMPSKSQQTEVSEIASQELTLTRLPMDMSEQSTKEIEKQEIPLVIGKEETGGSKTEMEIQVIPINKNAQVLQAEKVEILDAQGNEIPSEKDTQSDVTRREKNVMESLTVKTCEIEEVLEETLPLKSFSKAREVRLQANAANEPPFPSAEDNTLEQEEFAPPTWSMEQIGVVERTPHGSEKETKYVIETSLVQGTEWSLKEQEKGTAQKALPPAMDTGLVFTIKAESNESERAKGIATESGTCNHEILIEQFLERISRLEKDKECLEERYDELRQKTKTDLIYPEERYTTRDGDHDHSCNVVNDYSSNMEYITSPRDELSSMCGHFLCHNCSVHDTRESIRISNQMLDDYEYYKTECEQIKREKERLKMAYESEKRQKEELERNYRNETEEKIYLEERYQEILSSISRFDETIRSLRGDNELLQKNLTDWVNSWTTTPTVEVSRVVQGNACDIEEYRRSIQALEKENSEFRTILEVLSKKNESEESLKTIELGLARENDFVELKRERIRLESGMKEMKRTNHHQQEKIEEIKRESTTEIARLKEKQRKMEKLLKERERIVQEKDEEIFNMKKQHLGEIQAMQLQNELSKEMFAKNQIKDLQAKVMRLEEERERLRGEMKTTAVTGRDRYSGLDTDQDIEVARERYEEERRSKNRLASDMKCLLSDIMDLKERNLRLQEDFNRERMEIKAMIEKQANEITHEYVMQISKLQRSLIEETKRRQEAEAGGLELLRNQGNSTSLSSGQKGKSAKSGWSGSEIQQELSNEIQRRESLEIENKKLLYKINDILSGEGDDVNKAFDNANLERTFLNRNERRLTSSGSKDSKEQQKALHDEIEDLHDKLEDMKKVAKRSKDLKRKNEDLEEEVSHLTRKKDELLACQRNLTREVDHLSRALEEVEKRNRSLSDETERLTRRIKDIEDSFKQEKISLERSYENEKARAVEKSKQALEDKLQIERDTTKALEEKILLLEERGLVNAKGGGTNLPSYSITSDSYKFSGNSNNQERQPQNQNKKLKQEIQRLEAVLQDVNKKHADELRNQRMSNEFQREKQSFKHHFENAHTDSQRHSDVEDNFQERTSEGGRDVLHRDSVRLSALARGPEDVSKMSTIQREHTHTDTDEVFLSNSGNPSLFFRETDIVLQTTPIQRESTLTGSGDAFLSVSSAQPFERLDADRLHQIPVETNFMEAGQSFSSISGGQVAFTRESRNPIQMTPIQRQSNFTESKTYRQPSVQNDFEKKAQEMQRNFNDEKKDILNRATRDKAKLEEEVREAKEKLTSYRRVLEEEMDDLKRKHRKEVDFLNDKLQKENGKPRVCTNAIRAKRGSSGTHSGHFWADDMVKAGTDGGILTEELEKQKMVLTSEFEKEKSQFENEKKKLTETIHALKNEINTLRKEKRDYKQEIEKLTRIHKVEKVSLLRRSARDKDDEISRIKEGYEERLSSEHKRSDAIIDELRRKMSSMERKVKELELQLRNERKKYQEEQMTFEKSLLQSREDLKMTLDMEYRKKLSEEKLRYDETITGLTKQISCLQDQRKQIQEKILSNELLTNSHLSTRQLSRTKVIIQMEEEFWERASQERRMMEEKISDLQQEVTKLQREKCELKETMETEKRELQEDLEKMQEGMRRKLSKARDEMDRRTEAMTKAMMENRIKAVQSNCEVSSQHSPQCEVKQYRDHISSVEQRNLTLKAKNERLERELRVMVDRFRCLESRNKDLEAASREEWGGIRGHLPRSNIAYQGEVNAREGNDFYVGYSSAGPRSELRMSQLHPRCSAGFNQANAQTLPSSGQSYGDILERVRYTMHTTGSISDALGRSKLGSGAQSNLNIVGTTSSEFRRSGGTASGPLNQISVNASGNGIVSRDGYSAFKDLRNSLIIRYDDGFIDDEDFILLYDLYSSKDLDFPYDVYAPFDLDELDEAECVAEFRFRKRDVRALAEVLRVPDTITCEQGSVCAGIEGLCMLLRRMAYPCRYGDMIPRYAKPVPVLSMITNQMLDFIYNVHGYKVLNWNHDLLSPANLQTYVDTVTAKGAPLDNCFGFIDGTMRAIARPEQHQRILYNGHKRVHALKFQSIALPNGLMGNLYGPVEGRKHDEGMLVDSGLLHDL